MNMENWANVPPQMQSDEIFHAMLRSPFNAAGSKACPPSPLVLQLGLRQDCDNTERVSYAVRHSGYNFLFASKNMRANASILAWAAATEEVKAVSEKDASEIYEYKLSILNKPVPPHLKIPDDVWQERLNAHLTQWIASLSLEYPPRPGEFPTDKAAAYFVVPEAVRELLWPGHTSGRKTPLA
jgi:hypothetical protein